ncbi:MAG: hypothetical protein K1X67_00315 [Fimbriimonadaceae bacterium]|nr:hypothetical protein [Fimbriimonadaceae bacterium]
MIIWAGRGILVFILFALACLPVAMLEHAAKSLIAVVGLASACAFFGIGRWMVTALNMSRREHVFFIPPAACIWIGSAVLALGALGALVS